jgi:hypothetical protein
MPSLSGCAVFDHLPFREIWVADFEFIANSGERPNIICLVALELRSGRKLRLWSDQLGPRPPFPIDTSSLFVAFFASADLGCFKVLNWPMPVHILDPFVEFRNSTNVLQRKGCRPVESSLIAALAAHGLDTIGAIKKERMRALILRGGPWSAEERKEILDYCESDVAALAQLLSAMSPRIDLPRALLRGRYMAAVAAMEHAGVPIDTVTLERLRRGWYDIQGELIRRIDADYGVFDGLTFKYDRFADCR